MTGVLSIGSNLGDRLAHLQLAVDTVADAVGVVAVSGVYETDFDPGPVAMDPQPSYLNAVVLTPDAEPRRLLEAGREAERRAGRVRETRWGPRTLDVDVVACGDAVVHEPDLEVPHPRARERAFVLVPWAEVEPEAVLAGVGPVRDLVAGLPAAAGEGVVRRPDLVLVVPS